MAHKKSLNIRELIETLFTQGLITPNQMKRIASKLEKPAEESKDPLYIRILSGVGAWVAALFLILFLGISHLLRSDTSGIVFGVLFLAGGIVISRASKTTFLNQLSLALVFSGNILFLMGSVKIFQVFRTHDLSILIIAHTLVVAVAYPFFSNSIYRFLAPTALVTLITLWILDKKVFSLIHFLIAVEMLFTGTMLLLKKPKGFLIPLIYSAAIMLPLTILFMNLTQVEIGRGLGRWGEAFREPLWPSSLLLTAGLIYLYFRLAGGLKQIRNDWMILAVLATILLGVFTTPGVLVAIGLLVIGYAFDDHTLTGLSYLFLTCFLVLFYYALNINLAHKSLVIAGSGIVLLLTRWVLGHRRFEKVNQ